MLGELAAHCSQLPGLWKIAFGKWNLPGEKLGPTPAQAVVRVLLIRSLAAQALPQGGAVRTAELRSGTGLQLRAPLPHSDPPLTPPAPSLPFSQEAALKDSPFQALQNCQVTSPAMSCTF